jgi:ribonuclease inhibitor
MNHIIELKQSEGDRYENVHEWLKQALALPDWYGGNLDALWDCVTGHLDRPISITWVADSDSKELYMSVIEVFRDAAEEYDDITFTYVELTD